MNCLPSKIAKQTECRGNGARFEVLPVMLMKISIFLDMKLCTLACNNVLEAAGSSVIFVRLY